MINQYYRLHLHTSLSKSELCRYNHIFHIINFFSLIKTNAHFARKGFCFLFPITLVLNIFVATLYLLKNRIGKYLLKSVLFTTIQKRFHYYCWPIHKSFPSINPSTLFHLLLHHVWGRPSSSWESARSNGGLSRVRLDIFSLRFNDHTVQHLDHPGCLYNIELNTTINCWLYFS